MKEYLRFSFNFLQFVKIPRRQRSYGQKTSLGFLQLTEKGKKRYKQNIKASGIRTMTDEATTSILSNNVSRTILTP